MGIIFIVLMAIAFIGYVLPWGQMSFWGATVITNLLSPFPCLIEWICGGFYISNPTLKRFFIFPFIVCGFVIIHFYYLHYLSSNNSLGYNTNNKTQFTPFVLTKDIFGLFIIITLYTIQLYFGMLKAVPNKNAGFIILLTSILILLLFGECINGHFRILSLNCCFFLIIICFLWIGAQLPQEIFISYGRIMALFYYKIIVYYL